MNSSLRLDELLATIESAYGSLDEPHYDFAQKRYRVLRRHPVIGELMLRYYVQDDTDLNDHVSLHLRILHPDGSAVVCFSFVDNWAMLFRLASDSLVYSKVIESDISAAFPSERDIVLLLRKHAFKLLTKEEAAQPIEMNLFNTDRDESLIYHAIVADDGIVPQVLIH